MLDPRISCLVSSFVNAVSSALGGLFSEPVRLKLPSFSVLPISHGTTPGDWSTGVLTTTSPSLTLGGIPPPIPTMRPILMDEKVPPIRVATAAAELLPYLPFGRQAMTMVCFPLDPNVDVLCSFG